MKIQIITSSYPAYPSDPSGTAGLFVRAFALELKAQGHQVIIQPVGRKPVYEADEGQIIDPLPWDGGDQELASLKFFSIRNMCVVFHFFRKARKKIIADHQKYQIERTLCMWALPSGLLGYWMKKALNKPYDVWALGSDIWRIRKIPLIGNALLKLVIQNADRVFADGIELCRAVEDIAKCPCAFLPSSRVLPKPQVMEGEGYGDGHLHLLFVGRYHANKGPDLLLESFLKLKESCRQKIRLHMYGLGPLKVSLESFVVEYGLQDTVDINDVIDAQQLADLFLKIGYLIIPSRIESIPVIFSDALQSGVPVISTPVGDLKSLIEKHRCGILADSVSPDALARALERACEEDRVGFAQKAKELFQEFNLSHSVGVWQNF